MSTAQRVKIVAEAAQGFEGDARLARLLVKAAKVGGADIVKFQLVFADELATRDYPYYGLFKGLEMPASAWQAVADDAAAAGLGLAFDVFGEGSLDLALRLGAAGVKLHASDFFNSALVDAVFARAPHIYLSLGGIDYADVTTLVARHPVDVGRLTLMFGFQGEPTSIDQNHISRLAAVRQAFPGAGLGFMDHSDGSADEAGWLGVLPLAFGVSVVEKHITVDRALELEDFVSALDPTAFARYVARLRTAERALGSPVMELSAPEREYGQRAVKAIVASRNISAAATITTADVIALRAPVPEGRTVLRQIEGAVGRTAVGAIAAGQPICVEDLR
ncbi:MAG TPA: N-acetylneuraminate synthase family protein [Vicinamibacterales bacterium]|nr:N-acetylneuraminate synthase family protein [Vicinamibacterales bacterium]